MERNEIKQGETLKIRGEWIYLEGEKRKEGFGWRSNNWEGGKIFSGGDGVGGQINKVWINLK